MGGVAGADGCDVTFEQGHVGGVGRGVAEIRERLEEAVEIAATGCDFGVGAEEIAGKLKGLRGFGEKFPLWARVFLLLVGVDLVGDGEDFIGRGGDGLALGFAGEIDGRRDLAATAAGAGFGHLVEDIVKSKVVGLLERVEFMVVATGAIEGEAEPDSRRGLDAVEDVFDARFLGDATALAVEHVVAVETARDFLRLGGVGDEIAGELLDGELVVRHVRVEGVHDPIAPRPHGALGVALEAVGVRVAGEIEPFPRPALAETRGGEQSVHQIFECGFSIFVRGGDEGFDFGGGGWNAGEVEAHAADEGGGRSLG